MPKTSQPKPPAEPKVKKKPGRKEGFSFHAQFTDEDLKTIQRLAGIGSTNVQIAAFFGMTHDVFEERMRKNPDIKTCLEKGRATGAQKVMGSLFKEATEKGNMAAAIFYLKTRCGWKEPKQEIEVTSNAPIIQFGLLTKKNGKPQDIIKEAVEKFYDKQIE